MTAETIHRPRSFDVEGTEDGAVRPAPPEPEDPLPVDEEDGEEESGDEGEGEGQEPADLSEAELRERNDVLKRERASRRGRRKKDPPVGPAPNYIGTAPPRGAPAPPPARVVKLASAAPGEDCDDVDTWPTDALQLWERLLRHLHAQSPPIPAEQINITVSRKLVGPVAESPTTFQNIKGAAVVGYPPYSASEQLQRYLLSTYHSIGGAGKREGCGKAIYTLGFYWVATGKTIKVGHVEFDAYAVMVAIQQRANEFEASLAAEREQAEASGAAGAGAAPAYPARFASQARGLPPAGYSPTFGGQGVAPGADPSLHRKLGYYERMEEEFERARVEGRAPREIAPPETAPVHAPTVSDDERVARIATAAVQAALAQAGIRPQSEEERMSKLLAAQTDIITKNVLAVLGPVATAAGAAGAPAAAASPTAPAGVKQTVAAIKEMLEEFRALKEAESTFRDAFGGDEEPERAITPQQVVVEGKPQGFVEKAVGLLKQLPPGSMPTTLAVLGKMFQGSPAGNILAMAAEEIKAQSAIQPPRAGGGWGRKPGT